jgi:hypothetical protein
MKLLGFKLSKPSHREAVTTVLGALAVVVGFGIGASLMGTPLDRPGALALFVGTLYALSVNPFVSAPDARGRRMLVAACGAGLLIAAAAVIEQTSAF